MLRRVYLTGVVLIVLFMGLSTAGLSETEEPTEPIFEYDYHLNDPLDFIIEHQGEFSLDISIKVYDEPQGEDNSDGLDAGHERDWDEPLYYKGSTKAIWFTYNGYGITIVVDGPDLGLNTDVYIQLNLRYIVINIEIHISTGIIPL